MKVRTLTSLILAALLITSSVAFAAGPPARTPAGQGQARKDGALAAAAAKIQAVIDAGGLPEDAAARLAKAIAALEHAAAQGDAAAYLQAVLDNPNLPAEAKAQIEAVLGKIGGGSGAQGQPQAAQGQTKAEAQGGGRAQALARILTHLQGILAEGKKSDRAQANLEALIEKMTAAAAAEGAGEDEQEQLEAVEEAIKGKKQKEDKLSDGELDVLAEVQARQGKKTEAKATLMARLQQNPRTQKAYDRLVALQQESGEHQSFDTFVEGRKVGFDVRPLVKEGRTLMPIRALVESLGATVEWNAEAKTATISKGSTTVVLTIGSNTATVNGQEVQMDVAAEIEGGRTLVPARFVSQGLGMYVSWLAHNRTIIITEEPLDE